MRARHSVEPASIKISGDVAQYALTAAARTKRTRSSCLSGSAGP